MHAGLGESSSMLRPQGGCRYTSMQQKSTSLLQAITGAAPVATGSAHADCCTIWSGIRAGKRLETTVHLQYRAMLFCIQTAQGLHLDFCKAGWLPPCSSVASSDLPGLPPAAPHTGVLSSQASQSDLHAAALLSKRLSTLSIRTASHPVVRGAAPSLGHISSPQQHPLAEGPEADLHICL